MTHIVYGRIEVARVDDNCWRLCDGALPENDPTRVIALAELKDGHVTVLWLRKRNRRSTFVTFEQALRATEKVIYDAERKASGAPSRSRTSLPFGALWDERVPPRRSSRKGRVPDFGPATKRRPDQLESADSGI